MHRRGRRTVSTFCACAMCISGGGVEGGVVERLRGVWLGLALVLGGAGAPFVRISARCEVREREGMRRRARGARFDVGCFGFVACGAAASYRLSYRIFDVI